MPSVTLSSLIGGGGVPVGSTIYYAEGVALDYLDGGARYLVSGSVETDATKFDTDIFKSNLLQTTAGTITVFGASNVVGVAYNGGIFVALSNTGQVATSPDGITWTIRSVPTPANFTTGIFAQYLNGLFFVGGGGSSTSRLYSSPDGVTWTERSLAFAVPNVGVYGIAFSGARYVAVAAGGYRSYSDNLTSWTAAGNSGDATSIAFGNGVFCIPNSSSFNKFFTSVDGISWSETVAGPGNIKGIAFGNGLFVCCGDAGALLTSADGTNWVSVSTVSDPFKKVAFDYGEFFVLGGSVSVLWSDDGVVFSNATTLGITPISAAVMSSRRILVGAAAGALRDTLVVNYAGAKGSHTVGTTKQYVRIS